MAAAFGLNTHEVRLEKATARLSNQQCDLFWARTSDESVIEVFSSYYYHTTFIAAAPHRRNHVVQHAIGIEAFQFGFGLEQDRWRARARRRVYVVGIT